MLQLMDHHRRCNQLLESVKSESTSLCRTLAEREYEEECEDGKTKESEKIKINVKKVKRNTTNAKNTEYEEEEKETRKLKEELQSAKRTL